MNSFNPELQLIEFAIRNKLIDLLSELKCFKFITTLVSQFKKIEIIRIEKMIKQNDTFYANSKAETIINESDIDDAFELIYTTIISNMQKSLGKCSGWIIQS